jgi:hypothetical protein
MQVASLDTTELLEGGWREGCLLLVMPGGADLPYCKHLNGRGNCLIRGEPIVMRTAASGTLLLMLWHTQGAEPGSTSACQAVALPACLPARSPA